MSLRLILALVCAAVVFGQGGAPCSTSYNCSLNGDCVDNKCVCDPWWAASPICDVLALLPANKSEGYHNASGIASWGGMSIQSGSSWFLFAAEMENFCGLGSWKTNSRIVRGTSTSGLPGGPFAIDQVVSVPFSHNPKVFQAPDGTFLLFSIGSGLWETTPAKCAPPSDNGIASLWELPPSSSSLSSPPQYPGPCGDGCGPGALNGGCGLSLGVSKSINGPWTFSAINVTNQSQSALLDCAHTNPSPWIFPNGSILMAINAGYCHNGLETIGLLSAPSWRGPWSFFEVEPILHSSDGSVHVCEDPFLYVTERGFHLMVHNFGSTVALYAHSLDARTWVLHDDAGNPGPYSDSIAWDDGTFDSFDVERPQFIFDPATGKPIYLTNGAQGNPASFTLFRPLAMVPPPPPPPPVSIVNAAGLCLSTPGPFPCWNSSTGTFGICPLIAQDCSTAANALWTVEKTTIASASSPGAPPINVDCNSCNAGTVAKLITTGASGLVFDATNKQIQVASCSSSPMCLTTGSDGGAHEPCGGGTEPWSPTQVHVAPCSDPATVGWQQQQ